MQNKQAPAPQNSSVDSSVFEVLRGDELIYHFMGGWWQPLASIGEGIAKIDRYFRSKMLCQYYCEGLYYGQAIMVTKIKKDIPTGVSYKPSAPDGKSVDFRSWEKIMPAIKAWSEIKVSPELTPVLVSEYQNRCKILDQVVTTYNIDAVWNQLVSNLDWYYRMMAQVALNQGIAAPTAPSSAPSTEGEAVES